MDDKSELERHPDALYVAVKNGAAVDRQAAFDVAMNELGSCPLQAEARELAEASVTDGDETRLASAVRAFLDACGYEPGSGAGTGTTRAAREGAGRRAGRHAGDRAERGCPADPAGLESR